MPVAFKFQSNTQIVLGKMQRAVAREVPFAIVSALTKTATELNERNTSHMRRVFDNPTDWTLKAFRVDPALMKPYKPITRILRKNKVRGTPSNVTPNRQHYLEVQDSGGLRPSKAFERRLSGTLKGASRYRYATPTSQQSINQFGNLSRANARKLSGNTDNKYFVPKPNHPLTQKYGAGVYQRMAKNKVRKRLHLHEQPPNYRGVLRFGRRMISGGRNIFPRTFQKQLRDGMRKARLR